MASTEVDYQPAGEKKTGIAASIHGFRTFMYNGEKGEIMGRTGSSWGKIGIFYLIFYSCLAAFFAAFLAGLLNLMSDKYPNQTGMNSLIKGNPGMGFRPQPNVEETLVLFTQGESHYETYEDHLEELEEFLESYTDEAVAKDVEKSGGLAPSNCTDGDDRVNPEDQACRFKLSELGDWCTAENKFGYEDGEPCVLLKMNKVYGWAPEPYDNGSLPNARVKANWAEDFITVTCEGENDEDKDMIGEVQYYPPNGFQISKYYPYYNQPGYRSPLVMARFKNPLGGALVQVWCKVWAKNIYHDKNDKAGSVHFELQVD